MTTIIRRFGAPAAFPASIILDLEPPIDWGGTAPAGYFRLNKTLANALKNKTAGAPDAFTSGAGALAVDMEGTTAPAATGAAVTFALSGPFSFLSVFRQTVAGVNQTLMGNANTAGGDSAGLVVTSSGNLTALSRFGSANFAASLPKDGGDRWEFVAATFDPAGGAGASSLRLYRPRTGSVGQSNTASIPASIPTVRILGSSQGTLNQSVRGALSAFFPGVALSQARVDSIYASAKASLATSGIEI